ncbi:hypothetical protein PHYPSEUDO_002188 [Phytophthora pseudosyringae]|uniref:Uncharacterized protein n=1 Tax=Phytophthora pseudosyringae TaxID=221518 RepID=A0A8T1VTN4_9STRA|nr:hypothetical protein PHYPSEUDO_002188 [Phytophthora pseudosyringae]
MYATTALPPTLDCNETKLSRRSTVASAAICQRSGSFAHSAVNRSFQSQLSGTGGGLDRHERCRWHYPLLAITEGGIIGDGNVNVLVQWRHSLLRCAPRYGDILGSGARMAQVTTIMVWSAYRRGITISTGPRDAGRSISEAFPRPAECELPATDFYPRGYRRRVRVRIDPPRAAIGQETQAAS